MIKLIKYVKIFNLLSNYSFVYDIINKDTKDVLKMYVLTKSVLALMIGFIIASIFGLGFVPFMKKKHFGQVTSKFVKQHKGKSGTPTMGGIIFIVSTLVTILALVLTNKMEITTNLLIVLFVFLGYAVIGFIDDFLKLKFKSNGDIILQGCQVENSDIYKYDNRQVIKQKYDYKIGNVITVNGMRFYVIEDSDKSQSYVVAIKEEYASWI